MRKLAKHVSTVLVLTVVTGSMSVAMAGTLKPAQIVDAVATLSVVLGGTDGGPLSDTTKLCTTAGADGDQYATTAAKSVSGESTSTSADPELNGNVTITTTLTSDQAAGTGPGGPVGEGVGTGKITLVPTTLPNQRWVGTFNTVVQALSATHFVARGFIVASMLKFSPALHKYVPTGERLFANEVFDINAITSGNDAGKFQVNGTIGDRTTPDASGVPVLGAKLTSHC